MALDMLEVRKREKIGIPLADKEILPENWKHHEFGRVGEVFYSENLATAIRVDPIPPNTWTPANSRYSDRMDAVAQRYKEQYLRDGTLLTLQTCGIGPWLNFIPAIENERLDMGGGDREAALKFSKSTVVELGLQTCRYFEHKMVVKGEIPGLVNPRALLVSGLVRTSDRLLVFGNRKSDLSGIGIIGGTYNAEKIENDSEEIPHPQTVMLDEVITETGVNEDDVKEMKFPAIIYDHLPRKNATPLERPVVFFDVQLGVKGSELLTKFAKSPRAHEEHSSLMLVGDNPAEITEFMRKNSPDKFHAPADSLLAISLRRSLGIQFP
jgi:hypothetical protein